MLIKTINIFYMTFIIFVRGMNVCDAKHYICQWLRCVRPNVVALNAALGMGNRIEKRIIHTFHCPIKAQAMSIHTLINLVATKCIFLSFFSVCLFPSLPAFVLLNFMASFIL